MDNKKNEKESGFFRGIWKLWKEPKGRWQATISVFSFYGSREYDCGIYKTAVRAWIAAKFFAVRKDGQYPLDAEVGIDYHVRKLEDKPKEQPA